MKSTSRASHHSLATQLRIDEAEFQRRQSLLDADPQTLAATLSVIRAHPDVVRMAVTSVFRELSDIDEFDLMFGDADTRGTLESQHERLIATMFESDYSADWAEARLSLGLSYARLGAAASDLVAIQSKLRRETFPRRLVSRHERRVRWFFFQKSRAGRCRLHRPRLEPRMSNRRKHKFESGFS